MKVREFFNLAFVYLILIISGFFPIFLKFVDSWCYFSPICLIFFIIAIHLYYTREKSVQLTDVLRNFLKEPPGKEFKRWYRYASILIFLSIVFQVSWIFDSIRDVGLLLLQNAPACLIKHHIFTLILSVEFLVILPLLYVRFIYKKPIIPKDEKPFPRKALILALSSPGKKSENQPEGQINQLRSKLEEIGNPYYPSEENFKDITTNWIPSLRAVLHETEYLEEVFVLTSMKVEEYYDRFKEFLKIVPILRDRIDRGLLKLHKVPGIDANDFSSVKNSLEYLTASKLVKYHDRDISFNITGGTAIMSAAMILEAVHGDRQAEYIKQSENPEDRKLIRIDVTEKDVAPFGN